jgi:hypothetical protein
MQTALFWIHCVALVWDLCAFRDLEETLLNDLGRPTRFVNAVCYIEINKTESDENKSTAAQLSLNF